MVDAWLTGRNEMDDVKAEGEKAGYGDGHQCARWQQARVNHAACVERRPAGVPYSALHVCVRACVLRMRGGKPSALQPITGSSCRGNGHWRLSRVQNQADDMG